MNRTTLCRFIPSPEPWISSPWAVTDAVSLRLWSTSPRYSALPCLLAPFHCHLKMLTTSWDTSVAQLVKCLRWLPVANRVQSRLFLIWPALPARFLLPVLALPACLCCLICSSFLPSSEHCCPEVAEPSAGNTLPSSLSFACVKAINYPSHLNWDVISWGGFPGPPLKSMSRPLLCSQSPVYLFFPSIPHL